jgi:tRNA threonylcarbamoyladenosine biosynthesis protein TsaE
MDQFLSKSTADTRRLGHALGRLARPGDVLALYGELGAGKTQLTKGIAVGAGFRQSRTVTSPSFVLVHEYAGRLPIYHVDAYRLKGGRALLDLGGDELLYGEGLCIVEWADHVAGALPQERLDILLEHEAPETRRIQLIPRGKRYEEMVGALREGGYLSDTDQ